MEKIEMKKMKISLALWLAVYSLSLSANEEALSYIANISKQADIKGLERIKPFHYNRFQNNELVGEKTAASVAF